MTVSGMQQAHNLRAEEAAEMVRNHESGTRFWSWLLQTEADGNIGGSRRTKIGGGGAIWLPGKVLTDRAHAVMNLKRGGLRPGLSVNLVGGVTPEGT